MTAEVNIVQVIEVPAMSIRVTVPNDKIGESMGSIYGEVRAYVQKNGVNIIGPPFAYYHSFDMEKTDMECGFPVQKLGPEEGRVKRFTLPAGKAAKAMHVGPYDRLVDTYGEVMRYLEEKKIAPSGAMWEYYLNDPTTTPPQELRTELYWIVG